jgi:hypothetical protein
MNSLITKVGISIVALAIAFATGRFMTPEKVITQDRIKTEVEYITREVKTPDGTVIKEVIRKDVIEKEKLKLVESKKPDYKVSLLPKYSLDTKEITYGASVEKRLAGPIFGGIYADSQKNIGLVISLEF